MKKSILTVFSLLLVLALVGCAPSAPATDAGETPAPKLLTKEEVKTIVFTHAKMKAPEVTDLDVDLDEEDGAVFYDLEFDHKDQEYDYRVDAYTGKILYDKAEPKETAPQPAETQPPETKPVEEKPVEQKPAETKPAAPKPASTSTKKKIGVSAAKKAAFSHAKVKSSDAWDVEVDLDTENGKLVYEVSFDAGGYEYDYDIDAYTGKVVRNEKEKDN